MLSIIEIYGGIFMIFSKFGSGKWPPQMKAEDHNGVAGVSIVMMAWFFGAFFLTERIYNIGDYVNKFSVAAFCIFLYFINYYILIIKKIGIRQINNLRNEGVNSRFKILALSGAISVLSFVFLFISIALYRRGELP